MRTRRLTFTFLAFYLVFVGGSAYYNLFFPIRVFHHILLTGLMALWLVMRLRSGSGLPSSPINPPLYAAVGVWFLTAAFSLDPRMGLENIWFPLMHVLMFFVLLDLLQRGFQRLVMEIQFIIAAVVVFISLVELGSWYFGWGILPGTSVGWAEMGILVPPEIPALSLAMNISTLLAGYVAPLILLSITWALTVRRRDYRRTLWILTGLLTLVLILTFSRGGLLALMAGLGTFVLMRLAQYPPLTRKIPGRAVFGLGIVIGAAGLLVYVALILPYGRGASDQGRLDMWRSAVEMTIDHPLTGVGPGQFGRALRDYRSSGLARDKLAAAHNAYLNTASETGLIGIGISLWLGVTLLYLGWRAWRRASGPSRRLRIEGMFAALVTIAVHSLVDTFTTTPLVLLLLLIAAYLITGHRSRLDARPLSANRLTGLIALIVILSYGVWWIVQADRAQGIYMDSLANTVDSLEPAKSAAEIDPNLNLYKLGIAHLTGLHGETDEAIAAYADVLKLEPTWDLGWINLAALYERQGEIDTALNHLELAWKINPFTPAPLHWARLAEAAGYDDEEKIVGAYFGAMRHAFNPYEPLAEFWWKTPLREEAIRKYISTRAPDEQYRLLVNHKAQEAYALVPDEPHTAGEWWITGEYRLNIEGDAQYAANAFSRAIDLNPTEGDYYAARARALLQVDHQAVEEDIRRARLYGTRFENTGMILAELAETDEEKRRLKASAVPVHAVGQEFAAVLYGGRPSAFVYLPEVSWIGPGRETLDPWYSIAYDYLENDQQEDAIRVFEAILDVAPNEEEAQHELTKLR